MSNAVHATLSTSNPLHRWVHRVAASAPNPLKVNLGMSGGMLIEVVHMQVKCRDFWRGKTLFWSGNSFSKIYFFVDTMLQATVMRGLLRNSFQVCIPNLQYSSARRQTRSYLGALTPAVSRGYLLPPWITLRPLGQVTR